MDLWIYKDECRSLWEQSTQGISFKGNYSIQARVTFIKILKYFLPKIWTNANESADINEMMHRVLVRWGRDEEMGMLIYCELKRQLTQ